MDYLEKNAILGQGWLGPPIRPSCSDWEPTVVEKSYYLTLKEAVDGHLRRKGNWSWLNCVRTGEVLTARGSFVLGQKFAAFFSSVGMKKGDVVHLLLGNHNMVFSSCFGAWILGAVPSSGEVTMESSAIADQLKQAEASFLLCRPETAPLAVECVAKAELSGKVKIFCLGRSDTDVRNILGEVQDTNADEAPEPYAASNPGQEVAVIFWTSGTTGRPKGIAHSHPSFINHYGAFNRFFKNDGSVLVTNAFYHAGNFTNAIQCLLHGDEVHHTFGLNGDGNTIELVFDTILRIKPYMTFMGAFHYVCLGESPMLESCPPEQLDSIEVMVPAGSATPDSVADKFRAKLKNLKITINPYGLSELGLFTLGSNQKSLGEILPYAEVKIKDPDTEELCRPGQQGEICAKSCSTMLSYINRPEETSAFFGSPGDGFCHTGDLAYYDKEGNLFYVDRMKELIKYKYAPLISPTELEAVMQTHPAVKESMAFGRPEPTVRELVTMVVVPKAGFENISEVELIEHVNSQVADYKKIRGGVLIRKSIPRNSFGKLVRRTMRVWALEEMQKQEKMINSEKPT